MIPMADALKFLPIPLVIFICCLCIWQYRARSRPIIAYTASIDALRERIAAADAATENLPATLGALTQTALGGAVASVAPAGQRAFSAHAIINESLITADVTDLRRFETVPGQIVAGGLAITFILLGLAISQAATALSSPGADQVEEMRRLLSIAGTKFVVSIAAIIASIILVQRRNTLLIRAETALAALANTLDRVLPLVTESNEALRLARQQVATLARLEDTLIALSKPATALPTALADAMLPVATSINTMGDRIASTNADALERMVMAFSAELGGATLRYNQQLADILRETSNALDAAPGQIHAAAKSTELLLATASENTRIALESAAGAFTTSTDRLEAIADQARRAEQKLDTAMGSTTANADAAAGRLVTLTERIEAAETGLAAAAASAAAAAASAADANAVLARTTETAVQMRDAMTADTTAWTAGMDEVDRKMASVLDKVRLFKPPAARPDNDDAAAAPAAE